MFLRARESAQAPDPGGKSDLRMLFDDFGALSDAAGEVVFIGGIAWEPGRGETPDR